MNKNQWKIIQAEYSPADNRKYETIFTLANGYRGLRGTLEFSDIGQAGNYISGIFDKSNAQAVEIVNCQNPLKLNIYADEPVKMDTCDILDFKRALDMKCGILHTIIIIRTPKGKELKIESQRFVSRNNVHRWGAIYHITPINFSGDITIESIIDGSVLNNMYNPLEKAKHIKVLDAIDLNPGIALKTTTIDRGMHITEATLLKASDENISSFNRKNFSILGDTIGEVYQFHGCMGKGYTFYKYGATYTSRDSAGDTSSLCISELQSFSHDGFESELKLHKDIWKDIWNDIDIVIEGDEEAQLGIRFSLYHLASCAYDGDDRVSIAAKGLHGEGYRGHVFWDTEIFMLPFFIYTQPHVARKLLMYRYNNLDGARENAGSGGFKGARFPWESADTGVEVTPEWGIDFDGSIIKIWTGIEEYHINSDITRAIWEYFRATGDNQYMRDFGYEVFFDTAKFWQSKVVKNHEKDRYEITRVIGPDEFHEHVDNNAYTNYLARWSIKRSLKFATEIMEHDKETFTRLSDKLKLTMEDFYLWDEIQSKLYIPKDCSSNLLEQFEGYFKLHDIVVEEYDMNGMPLLPDLKGFGISQTTLVKQADVVMLLLLCDEPDKESKKQNYAYYEKRTLHKSSLSPSVYSIVGLSVGDTSKAYNYFMKTIMTDLRDNQGNTADGIHAAAAGGAWQSAVFGFGGFSIDKNGTPAFNPWIPEKWSRLSFKIKLKGSVLTVSVTQNDITIASTEYISIMVYGLEYKIKSGRSIIVQIK